MEIGVELEGAWTCTDSFHLVIAAAVGGRDIGGNCQGRVPIYLVHRVMD